MCSPRRARGGAKGRDGVDGSRCAALLWAGGAVRACGRWSSQGRESDARCAVVAVAGDE